MAKTEKANTSLGESRASARQSRLQSWELIALVLLLVTVFGVAIRGPVNSFPDKSLSRDPYDLQSDRGLSSSANAPRGRVETGL